MTVAKSQTPGKFHHSQICTNNFTKNKKYRENLLKQNYRHPGTLRPSKMAACIVREISRMIRAVNWNNGEIEQLIVSFQQSNFQKKTILSQPFFN